MPDGHRPSQPEQDRPAGQDGGRQRVRHHRDGHARSAWPCGWSGPARARSSRCGALGVDPLDPAFTVDRLAALLGGQSATLKTPLTTQSLIAGVGNAYSDEALHRARLSPFKKAANLDGDEVAVCTPRWWGSWARRWSGPPDSAWRELKRDKKRAMQVHGRTGEACPVCGDTVRQVSFATKSLQYCPTCQTGGKILADRRLSRLLK